MNLNFINFIESFIDPSSGKKYDYATRNEFLKKFENRKDVFVTFHNVPKFGLNPINKYNTPTGIYSYPINYVISLWDEIELEFKVPFASRSHFFTIFRHVKNKLIIIDRDIKISGFFEGSVESSQNFEYNPDSIKKIKYPSIDNTKYEIAQSKTGQYYAKQDKLRYNWMQKFTNIILKWFPFENLFDINYVDYVIIESKILIELLRNPQSYDIKYSLYSYIKILTDKLKILAKRPGKLAKNFSILADLLENYLKMVSVIN